MIKINKEVATTKKQLENLLNLDYLNSMSFLFRNYFYNKPNNNLKGYKPIKINKVVFYGVNKQKLVYYPYTNLFKFYKDNKEIKDGDLYPKDLLLVNYYR